MARGLGHALQTVLAQEGPGEDLEIEGPSLANARRRHVFRYLCLRPCARVGEVARALDISHATARWHERDLLENGYLDRDGSSVFPRGLIHPEDVSLFRLLASPGRAAVLAACHANPGVCLLELAEHVGLTRQSASKTSLELADLGLLVVVEDGRYRRHYPTDLIVRRRDASAPRIAAFTEALVRRLDEDGLRPEVLRTEPGVLILRLGTASRHVVLDVPLDPYATAWRSER